MPRCLVGLDVRGHHGDVAPSPCLNAVPAFETEIGLHMSRYMENVLCIVSKLRQCLYVLGVTSCDVEVGASDAVGREDIILEFEDYG